MKCAALTSAISQLSCRRSVRDVRMPAEVVVKISVPSLANFPQYGRPVALHQARIAKAWRDFQPTGFPAGPRARYYLRLSSRQYSAGTTETAPRSCLGASGGAYVDLLFRHRYCGGAWP